ncbi:hypothetical protein WJX81_002603 [Elliptochloris bilobata]|uniref:TOG domain-containing protein n=1 Tax=Elliptochloris bilobata TaxID=381761 RepID=A0AAW1QYR3_9CHLO
MALPHERKLHYTIYSCSGEDPSYPATELLRNSTDARGWQSPKGAPFPVEVAVALEQPSHLERVQILSHEFKIAERLELFAGVVPSGGGEPQWTRLGSIGLDPNERSGFQARELKTVGLRVAASHLRFVARACHSNTLNTHRQVGIAALNLLGVPLAELHSGASPDLYGGGAALRVDAATAAELARLAAAKEAAVAAEDYDEAKRLKGAQERLRAVGAQIAALEARKGEAVAMEDYDAAKALKAEIARVRATAGALGARRPTANLGQGPSGGIPYAPGPAAALPGNAAVSVSGYGGAASPVSPAPRRADDGGSVGSLTPAQAYDDRLAVARSSYPDAPANAPGECESAAPLSACVPAAAASALGPPPEGWPAELPAPEQPVGADAKDADEVAEAVGPYAAAALVSAAWQLREAAALWLERCLLPGLEERRRGLARAAARVLPRLARDRVANVYGAALALLRALLAARPAVAPMAELVPVLLDRVGENNARIHAAACAALLELATAPGVGLGPHLGLVTRQFKSQLQCRPVLHRLELLAALLREVPIARAGAGDGLHLEPLMRFLGNAFGSPNADVRAAAVRVSAQVISLAGGAARALLPSDMHPKLREQLDAALGALAFVGDQPAGESEVGEPAGDPALYQAEVAAREAAFGPGHPAVAEALTNLAIVRTQRGEPDLAQPLYERALAVYEVALGPEHPEVAHTLTDLAVLHLEQGREDAGHPLLRRALAIQTRALGADHPDVVAIREVLDQED